MSRLLIALVAASCVACGGGSHPAEPAPAPPAAGEEQPDIAAWMRSHFVEGRAIRDALARGDVQGARARLAQVSEEPGPREAPAGWQAPLEALRAAAHDAAVAEDADEVAAGFAELAARCADCHVVTHAQPTFESSALPAEEEAPAPMQRHQWAAQEMWRGLVEPSALRYRDGARTLAEAPLHSTELVVGQSPPLEVLRLAEHARDVAARASHAETQEERAALYGELLTTCAGCHQQQ